MCHWSLLNICRYFVSLILTFIKGLCHWSLLNIYRYFVSFIELVCTLVFIAYILYWGRYRLYKTKKKFWKVSFSSSGTYVYNMLKLYIRVGQCLIENNLKWAILVLTEILYSITKLLLYKIVLSNHDKNCNLLRYWNPNLIIEFIWEPDSQTQILPHSFWIWPKLSNANI